MFLDFGLSGRARDAGDQDRSEEARAIFYVEVGLERARDGLELGTGEGLVGEDCWWGDEDRDSDEEEKVEEGW